MRNVAREDVWDHLAGFAAANDVGAQDFRDTDAGSMLRVKGQDGFCPVGPGIVRGVDIRQSRVRTYINGKVVQDGPVSEMTSRSTTSSPTYHAISLFCPAISCSPAPQRTRGQ